MKFSILDSLPLCCSAWPVCEGPNSDGALRRLFGGLSVMLQWRPHIGLLCHAVVALCLSPGRADNSDTSTKLSSSFRRHRQLFLSVETRNRWQRVALSHQFKCFGFLHGHADTVDLTSLCYDVAERVSEVVHFDLFDESDVISKQCRQA